MGEDLPCWINVALATTLFMLILASVRTRVVLPYQLSLVKLEGLADRSWKTDGYSYSLHTYLHGAVLLYSGSVSSLIRARPTILMEKHVS